MLLELTGAVIVCSMLAIPAPPIGDIWSELEDPWESPLPENVDGGCPRPKPAGPTA